MSFSITPNGAPKPTNPHAQDRAGKPSARERALAKAHELQQQAQPPQPVSPKPAQPLQEAVAAAFQATETPTDTGGQTQSIETPAAASPEPSPAALAEAPKAPEPSKEQPLSSQYAQLARKERALRAKAVELKQREDAFKASQTPAQQPPTTANGIPLEEFKKNPWKFMQEAGVTYDQVTKAALDAPSPEQEMVSSLQAKIEALEEKLNGTENKWKETWETNQKTQYQQAVNQIKSEVTSLVNENPDFETIKATNSVGDVVELIEKTFQEDGVLLSVEEAAKQVETYLEEEAYKLSQLKKIQNRLKPASTTVPAAPAKTAAQTPAQQQPSKTLTNAISGSRQMSARDRAMAAAIHGPNWREKI